MNVERSGHVKQPYPVSNCQAGGDTEVKAKPFVIEKRDVYRAGLLVKTNQGAAGVDGQTIADFESNLKDNLYTLWNRLSSGSYYPPPVKGVAIPKKSGGELFPRLRIAWRKWWSGFISNRLLSLIFCRIFMATDRINRQLMPSG